MRKPQPSLTAPAPLPALTLLTALALLAALALLPACDGPKPRAPLTTASAVTSATPAATASTSTATAEPTDRYRKYEAMESPEVLAWVKTQNDKTRRYLDALPSRAEFHKGVDQYIRTPSLGLPFKTRRGYLYKRKLPDKAQSVLLRAKRYGKNEETILDPNQWSADGTQSLFRYVLSHNERYLAYGITSGGSDWRSWRILDLTTKKLLKEELRGLKWGSVSWAPGDVGLLYSGYPDRSHAESAKGTGNRVYYHALNTDQSADPEVFVPPNDKWITSVDVSDKKDFVEIYLYKSSDGRGRVQLYPLKGSWPKDPKSIFKAPSEHVLSPDFAWRQWSFGSTKDNLYLFTEQDAPTGKVVRYTLADKKLTTIVPPREETLITVSHVGNRFFAKYVKDVQSFIVVYDEAGKQVDEIRLPYPANIGMASGRTWHDEAFFYAEGYIKPYSIFRYPLRRKQKPEEIWSLKIDFDSADYVAKQVFYKSGDDTQVPLFLVHHKSVKTDGQNPTILLGYGCYGYLLPIAFNSARVPWLRKGGVYAVANIRGGGAYGDRWHAAGKRENKQRSIDDFIAAAQWLTDQKYTSADHLTISGASCGGLLVGATATQRPDMFAGAAVQVGVLDLLRYHKFSGAYLWEDELGSPDVPEERAYLKKLSPLLRAQRKQRYPAMLITTRKKDTRVVPMNSYKFAAAVQDHQIGDRPILLRVDETGGHSLGALPMPMRVDYLADLYAFAWDSAKPR